MDIQAKIGARIRQLRLSKNISQEDLAWRSELDRTFMNHVENSRRNVSIQSLKKIIENGLEISFKDFFSDDLFTQLDTIEKGGSDEA
ncbi:MAG: XRE family transcriptional regulator [Chitinophagia bacterium]|nr:XRE family transcriptional regulator [Chitinophagia bacterium]